jgi:hypothetical protein
MKDLHCRDSVVHAPTVRMPILSNSQPLDRRKLAIGVSEPLRRCFGNVMMVWQRLKFRKAAATLGNILDDRHWGNRKESDGGILTRGISARYVWGWGIRVFGTGEAMNANATLNCDSQQNHGMLGVNSANTHEFVLALFRVIRMLCTHMRTRAHHTTTQHHNARYTY